MADAAVALIVCLDLGPLELEDKSTAVAIATVGPEGFFRHDVLLVDQRVVL